MINVSGKIVDAKDLLQKLEKRLSQTSSLDELNNLWHKYLGKRGIIKVLLREIKNLTPEEKKETASLIQEIQKTASKLFKGKETELKELQLKQELIDEAESLDYRVPKIGHLHPITNTIRKINRVFLRMGFSIMDGPEIEDDDHCFRRLNVPPDHPARDMQDTIYIEEPNFLMRTQTSSIEARILEKYCPPLKVVSPGRVYRNEKPNKSNHFIFHHYQGLVVLKRVSLKDLFGIFNLLFREMYGSHVKVRYRNKYYPEVEPGVGPDMQCFQCKGKGCRLCKSVGWIEMGGAGIVHPNVLEAAGINSKKWKGFAFGLGLDRWVMAKYNITDIRTLLGGNLGYKYYENENII
jgi:phenylalanyl-tRNA synthetase alpha chain